MRSSTASSPEGRAARSADSSVFVGMMAWWSVTFFPLMTWAAFTGAGASGEIPRFFCTIPTSPGSIPAISSVR